MDTTLFVELNVTKTCNLSCAYCFEKGHFGTKKFSIELLPSLYKFIDNIILSDYFTSRYNKLSLVFWGGEPTIESDFILSIIQKYEKNDVINFFMYTNGFNVSDNIKSKLIELKDVKISKTNDPKFGIQISYDGKPIQDVKRVTHLNNSSTTEVKKFITFCSENDIPFSFKSVITPDTFKYLYDSYMDIEDILKDRKNGGYFPSIDVSTTYSSVEMKEYLNDLNFNMKKIIIHLLKNNEKIPFKWLDANKADCSAGINLISIDTDGKIYPCHGAFYNLSDEHCLGSLENDILILSEIRDKYERYAKIIPDECKKCEALHCVRCNVDKYGLSTKKSYGERWKDYTCNKTACYIYKEIGKIVRAYYKLKSINK